MKNLMRSEPGVPAVVDRATFQAELDALRVREKAHTREGDAIAYRLQIAKKPETRQKRFERFLAMLENGEKLY